MRPRVSTTVDGDLLKRARNINPARDAELFDAALRALITAHEHAVEDQALADHPYATDLGNIPTGTTPGIPLDPYDAEAPADVIEHFKGLGLA